MHGIFILQLKEKWSCEAHHGEHGEAGFCYVDPNGRHSGLNNRKLKIWAIAIVSFFVIIKEFVVDIQLFGKGAAEVTKNEPPNHPDFDGERNGRLVTTKPRGRGGPHAEPPAMPSTDPMMVLLTAIVANVTKPVAPTMATPLIAPRLLPVTPMKAKPAPIPIFSPVPTMSAELHACISDFERAKAIDLTCMELSWSS